MKKQYISICALLCSATFSGAASASALNTELTFSTELMDSYNLSDQLSGSELVSKWEMAALNPVMLTLAETAPAARGGMADAPLTSKPVNPFKKTASEIKSEAAVPTPEAEVAAESMPEAALPKTAADTEIPTEAIATDLPAPMYRPAATAPTEGMTKPEQAAMKSLPPAPVISTQDLFGSAKKSLNQGDRKRALQYLSQLLTKAPHHRSARLMYGTELVKDAQYAEASLILPELLNDSSDWRAWYWMGTASLMLGNLKDAENYLSEALARDGDIAALWVQRAIIEQESNNHQTALQLLYIAQEIEPDMPAISLNIAHSADALGNRDLANRAYGKFLTQTGKSPKHIRVRQKVLSLF